MPECSHPALSVRGMTADGRTTDGLPIHTGDRFLTRFGTATTPFPRQRHERYASQWLINNAVTQARSAGDSFNAAVFSGEHPNKAGYLPPASVACLQRYLFDTDTKGR